MNEKVAAEEEKEIEGAMNLEDLFSEEEDSLDGKQEENSRISPSKNERPTSVQDDKEEMVLEEIENSALEVGQVIVVVHETGHKGIWKTMEKIMKHFLWPGIHKDVSHFCRVCHVCQIAGKPNEYIKKAPLQPREVRGDPSTRQILAEPVERDQIQDPDLLANKKRLSLELLVSKCGGSLR
ncbi:uncharacterized protein [Palaemon carinicauda]|uniref:uncharacterized protein n=1 Tax=Palaemon carinicauda TaxID=392227 RepID=UPI0035B6993E